MAEAAFFAALAILAYAYFGYPLLIWLVARIRPQAVRRAACEPRVAVVIVAHNEVARIGLKLDTCLALDYPEDRLRIVVASDGSDDGTNAIVAEYASRGVRLLAFPVRRGKAACLNDAIASCTEEIVVLTDARQRLDAQAVRRLVENFADPAVGAASGELVFETDGITGFGEGVDAYWRYEKFIRQQEGLFASTVGVTGALYALRRECFREIPASTILDDVVIPMNVVMSGRRVVFDARALAYDLPSRDHRQERQRKVRTIAGNYQLLAAHPALLSPLRNPIWFQLVSHKMLRLAGPLCLLVALAANAALAPGSGFYQSLLAAQLACYALPALGRAWPLAGRWRLVKLATAFLALNWFALLGLLEFLRNRNAHLWGAARPAPHERTGG